MLSVIQANNGQNPRQLTLKYLLAALVKDGLIGAKRQQYLLQNRGNGHGKYVHPLTIIAEQGWHSLGNPSFPLSLEYLTRWLADHCQLPYLRIDPLKINVERITNIVSQAYASNLGILPIEVRDNQLTVATAQPFIDDWESELARIARLNIQRVVANPRDIQRYLNEFYGVSRSIKGATRGKSAGSSSIQNFEQLIEIGKVGEPDADDHHVVSIVDWMLQYAFEQRASDIHIEPRRDSANIKFRIDGMLHLVHELPSMISAAVASRLKTLGRMDIADKRRPQDGRIKTKAPDGSEIEMRLSSMPTAFGEKIVIRIFNPEMLAKPFEELGFTAYDQRCWESIANQPYGIVLVTGPTGSGKTTTLYSALRQLARPEVNICTVEDPIEMVDARFNQMQVQTSIDLNFAAGIRTLLRQDPDIIMVGEIRDQETANMAVQSALTGHLVFSTLHTNDAPSAITRLVDIGVQPFLINAALLGVVAQRLVRTLCPHCKLTDKADAAGWRALTAGFNLSLPAAVCQPVGCEECRHTGYMGRSGLYEILSLENGVRKLIDGQSNLDVLRHAALKHGMRPLRISGAQKIAAGLTTLEEVYAVIPPIQDPA